jgi:hypothetical protein
VVKVNDGVVKLTVVCAVLVTEAERLRLASRLAVLRRVVKIVITIDGCGRNKTDAHTQGKGVSIIDFIACTTRNIYNRSRCEYY